MVKRGKFVGELNPFYGKTHNEKTRKLISEKAKEKSPWNKGIKNSEEHKLFLFRIHQERHKKIKEQKLAKISNEDTNL